MQPQNTVSPAPNTVAGPPQPVAPLPPPAPNPQPRSKKGLLIFLMIVVLLIGGGAAAWFLWPKSDSQTNNQKGDANTGELLAGKYNYLNVCEVFTAADLDAATGETSNRQEILTTYAEKTYKDADPQRTYTSECQRQTKLDKLSSDYVTVTIYQFSDSAVQDKSKRLQSTRKFAKSPEAELADLGQDATFAAHTLYFTVDNKDISVKAVFLGNTSKERSVALAVAKSVKAKVGELSAKPSAVLTHSGEGQKVGDFAYRNSCDLFKPADYKTIIKIDPDEARVKTIFAEVVQKTEKAFPLRSSCTVQNLPPKTELDSGSITDFDKTNTYVIVDSEQYTTADDARLIFGIRGTGASAVDGIGDGAALTETTGPLGEVRILYVLKGNTIHRIEISRANSKGAGSTSADVDSLKQIGTLVVSR